MSERLSPAPRIAPLCGMVDTIELIAGGSRPTRRHPDRREWLYAVVHRSHGVWTHLYTVIDQPGIGSAEIHLIRIYAGDCLEQARLWALARWCRPVRPAP